MFVLIAFIGPAGSTDITRRLISWTVSRSLLSLRKEGSQNKYTLKLQHRQFSQWATNQWLDLSWQVFRLKVAKSRFWRHFLVEEEFSASLQNLSYFTNANNVFCMFWAKKTFLRKKLINDSIVVISKNMLFLSISITHTYKSSHI